MPLELLRLSEMTWTNSVSVLTHKSIWRGLPGHHVSDVPLLISFSLIADLKKLKKEKKNPVPLEIVPSHHQHTKHILCFGLIQLDVHWSFSCFQASLINFAVNGCLFVLFFPLSCVCSWIISLSWWLFKPGLHWIWLQIVDHFRFQSSRPQLRNSTKAFVRAKCYRTQQKPTEMTQLLPKPSVYLLKIKYLFCLSMWKMCFISELNRCVFKSLILCHVHFFIVLRFKRAKQKMHLFKPLKSWVFSSFLGLQNNLKNRR